MTKKPVMGHNPMDYRPLADAKFSFIPHTEFGSDGKDSPSEKKKPAKKTVSYYLEEDLINTIKEKAVDSEESYSGFVNHTLKKAIQSEESE